MTAPDPRPDERSRRQRSRALVMAALLAGFVVLIYAITITKMSVNQ